MNQQMRIIYAEDEPLTRRAMSRVLERGGYQVSAFEDGEAAWRAFEADPSPIIVTDWMMPKMTGIELCRNVREARLAQPTHVVIVTALSLSERTVEAFASGVDDIFAKPVEPSILLNRLAAADRSRLAHAEQLLARVLDKCQTALDGNNAALFAVMRELSTVFRQQRSYVRCRAFVRRQLALAKESFGDGDPRTKKLEEELAELQALEDQF